MHMRRAVKKRREDVINLNTKTTYLTERLELEELPEDTTALRAVSSA